MLITLYTNDVTSELVKYFTSKCQNVVYAARMMKQR